MAQQSAHERFWMKVDRTEHSPEAQPGIGPCWLWLAARRGDGYGAFGYPDGRRRVVSAHRVAWMLTNGPIPDGLFVLHRCDVKRCVRPDHLYLGSHADNMADVADRGRAPQVLYPDRFPRGERHYSRRQPERLSHGESHYRARLTANDVRAIRARYAARQASQWGLAHEFNVSRWTILGVLQGKSWKHLLPVEA